MTVRGTTQNKDSYLLFLWVRVTKILSRHMVQAKQIPEWILDYLLHQEMESRLPTRKIRVQIAMKISSWLLVPILKMNSPQLKFSVLLIVQVWERL